MNSEQLGEVTSWDVTSERGGDFVTIKISMTVLSRNSLAGYGYLIANDGKVYSPDYIPPVDKKAKRRIVEADIAERSIEF